jgi:hypothetical protein
MPHIVLIILGWPRSPSSTRDLPWLVKIQFNFQLNKKQIGWIYEFFPMNQNILNLKKIWHFKSHFKHSKLPRNINSQIGVNKHPFAWIYDFFSQWDKEYKIQNKFGISNLTSNIQDFQWVLIFKPWIPLKHLALGKIVILLLSLVIVIVAKEFMFAIELCLFAMILQTKLHRSKIIWSRT